MKTRMGWTSKKIVMDGDMIVDKRTTETLGPKADSTYCKDKLEIDFYSLYRP